jgi:hypothetical protein
MLNGLDGGCRRITAKPFALLRVGYHFGATP